MGTAQNYAPRARSLTSLTPRKMRDMRWAKAHGSRVNKAPMDERARPAIGTRRFAIAFLGLVALPLLSTATAGESKSKTTTPVASVEAPPPPKPGAPLGA